MLYAKLPFPLNVYALAILLEEGQVHHLHYGLFKDEDSAPSFLKGMCRASQFMSVMIPSHVESVLEVGPGFGTFGRLVRSKGIDYTAVCPDPVQAAYCVDLKVAEGVSYENYFPNRKFDCLVFHESTQYIGPETLYKAPRLLHDQGHVIILDEFAPGEIESWQPDELEETLSIDMTVDAVTSLELLVKYIEKHMVRVQELVGPHDAARMHELLDILNTRIKAYDDWDYVYLFKKYRRIA